jgi:pantothenate kinase
MKKSLGCYKEEIENMKKMEEQLTVESYQKLVNDFNQLYDHYKMHKVMAKKLKMELSQSNHRERTFLKLLKKTAEFGDQAA